MNVLLFLFFGYTMAFHVLEAPVPDKVARNPFALKPNVWPSVILALLMICIAINIYKVVKKNRGKEDFTLAAFFGSVPPFIKSKVFIAIVIVVAMSFLLEPLGFMVTCFIFLVAYGILLGDRKYLRLILISLGITLLLYICFGVLLSVNLPRGTVPALRNFALFLESLIP